MSWELTITTDNFQIAVIRAEEQSDWISSVVNNKKEVERGSYPSIRPPRGFKLFGGGVGIVGATGVASFATRAGREDEAMKRFRQE